MNPLEQYPSVRRALYTVQWILNGLATVLGAYFAATGTATDALPQWYVIGLAVLPVLWTYLGLTAAANTPAPQHRAEGGDVTRV